MLRTEQQHSAARGIDARPLTQVAKILIDAQCLAATTVIDTINHMCGAARTMANSLTNNGKIHYIGAGSSGLMAASDAMELRGSFGISDQQVTVHIAGGFPQSVVMYGYVEDDVSSLEDDLSQVSDQDTLIAVSASGTTPYTVAGARIGRDKDASVVAISNNPDTDLLHVSDYQILLATQPEVLSGSTRMGAGTAQKIALNTLSTLMAIELGHVYDGMMVNLVADNAKLRARAVATVKIVTNADDNTATSALAETRGNVKLAILLVAGASLDQAMRLLASADGHLRIALDTLNSRHFHFH